MNAIGTPESLALYSDWANTSAVVALTLALLLLSVTFAIGRTWTLHRHGTSFIAASPGNYYADA